MRLATRPVWCVSALVAASVVVFLTAAAAPHSGHSSAARADSPREASACAQCHSEARSAPSMYQALETVENCRILIDRPLLATTIGKYSYRIERVDSQSNYMVTDGAQSLTLPIRWALVSSSFGQTYILEKDGELYESRVSYFRELNGLGPTLGSAGITPANLVDAAGRYISRRRKTSVLRLPRHPYQRGQTAHAESDDWGRAVQPLSRIRRDPPCCGHPGQLRPGSPPKRSPSSIASRRKTRPISADNVIAHGRKSLRNPIPTFPIFVFSRIA